MRWALAFVVTETLWCLLIAIAGAFVGCAHIPNRPREYVACEPVGGVVSVILTGHRPTPVDAITLGSRTIYFRGVEDKCLAAHEAVHRRQENDPRFYGQYLDELAAHGYDGNRFEVEARRAQMECEAGR